MAEKPKSSRHVRGDGTGRGKGTEHHHGWAPDVNETRQQDNPSAERSFHAEQAPPPGKGRKVSRQERSGVPGDTVRSDNRRGEQQDRGTEEGMRDTGAKGRSRRPSGTRDASAFTGVNPDDSSDKGRRPG
ncbi:hypothetical protein [Streptomyces sp. NPDC012888]|uniref:hypothetical protein n=1 Tax=Streptomyces sp. NPDC012888 TaxID=3364855 RepID=UPI0036AF5897